jgi:hypothetical protein
MFRDLLITLLISASLAEAEEVWLEDPNVLSCSPNVLTIGKKLEIKLGPNHGKELAATRHSENLPFFLVVQSPPIEMVSLMSREEFEEAKKVTITSQTIGFRWDVKGGNEAVFSQPGLYTLYVSEVLESEIGGYKCSITVKNH